MFFSILRVFLWKHLKRIRFFWKTYFLYITAPIILIGLILSTMTPTDMDNDAALRDYEFQIISKDDLYRESISFGHNDKVFYSPNTTFFNDLIEIIRYKIGILDETVYGYKTPDEIYKHFNTSSQGNDIIIIFNIDKAKHNKIKFNYNIRQKANDFKTEKIYADSVVHSKCK